MRYRGKALLNRCYGWLYVSFTHTSKEHTLALNCFYGWFPHFKSAFPGYLICLNGTALISFPSELNQIYRYMFLILLVDLNEIDNVFTGIWNCLAIADLVIFLLRHQLCISSPCFSLSVNFLLTTVLFNPVISPSWINHVGINHY